MDVAEGQREERASEEKRKRTKETGEKNREEMEKSGRLAGPWNMCMVVELKQRVRSI